MHLTSATFTLRVPSLPHECHVHLKSAMFTLRVLICECQVCLTSAMFTSRMLSLPCDRYLPAPLGLGADTPDIPSNILRSFHNPEMFWKLFSTLEYISEFVEKTPNRNKIRHDLQTEFRNDVQMRNCFRD